MTPGSLLLGLALLVLVLFFVARPFLLPQPVASAPTLRQQLLAHKESLLDQIRELDFDYQTGKIAETAYTAQRPLLVRQAAALLQKLDQDQPHSQVEQEIETAVARLRQTATTGSPNGRYCPQCGQATDAGDRFCAHCGQNLTPLQTPA